MRPKVKIKSTTLPTLAWVENKAFVGRFLYEISLEDNLILRQKCYAVRLYAYVSRKGKRVLLWYDSFFETLLEAKYAAQEHCEKELSALDLANKDEKIRDHKLNTCN